MLGIGRGEHEHEPSALIGALTVFFGWLFIVFIVFSFTCYWTNKASENRHEEDEGETPRESGMIADFILYVCLCCAVLGFHVHLDVSLIN
ncbi:hypothetical protein F5Y04DRAFT_6403 [Hypomontagnella monticulosa]|nr:hypothetical protein F5Y04DRAFT_6403 [Hypomontagnella monticulosa]